MYGDGLSTRIARYTSNGSRPARGTRERAREDDLERVARGDVLLRAPDASPRSSRRRCRPSTSDGMRARSGQRDAARASACVVEIARARARRRPRRSAAIVTVCASASKTTMVAPPKKRASGDVSSRSPQPGHLLDASARGPTRGSRRAPARSARPGCRVARRAVGRARRAARAASSGSRRASAADALARRGSPRTDPLAVGERGSPRSAAGSRGSSSAPSARRRRRSRAGTTRASGPRAPQRGVRAHRRERVGDERERGDHRQRTSRRGRASSRARDGLDRRAPDRPRVRRGARDERRAALGEHALREIDVVLEPDARVAAEAHRELGHRLLVAADGGDAPRRARRARATRMKLTFSSRAPMPPGDAQHELEVQRRARWRPPRRGAQRLLDVADLVALELGDAPAARMRAARSRICGARVDEDVVAEVERCRS